MTALQEALKEIQDANPDMTFRQAWNQLRKVKPELFEESPATAPDNVPPGRYSHPAGSDSPDPRAKRFKNYDERSDDPRITRAEAQKVLRAELVREIAGRVNEIHKVEGVSFKQAWEIAKKKHLALFAEAARIEDGIVQATVRSEAVITAEAAHLSRYGLRPDDVPEPYRSDPWYH